MGKKIYKRRRSRYDPYRGEIEHLLAAGCTTGQITDAMQVHFETYITESSVYYYIRTNGLKTTVTKGARDGRVYIPQCRECEKRCCVINTTGRRVMRCLTHRMKYTHISCAAFVRSRCQKQDFPIMRLQTALRTGCVTGRWNSRLMDSFSRRLMTDRLIYTAYLHMQRIRKLNR